MRIVLGLIDGTKYEAEADLSTFGCLADRVAFERRFDVSAAVLAKVEEFVRRNDDGTTTVTDAEGLADVLREEHVLFLAWRELRRQVPDVPDDFDEVLESTASLGLHGSTREATPDPTTAAEPPSAN